MALRVLIVEDEPIIVMDLNSILEEAGHTVAGTADTMREALRIAGLEPVDVAIVDIKLVGQPDGIETARRLHSEHGITSLYLTGRTFDRERAMGSVSDAVGFITKPFTPESVIAALASLAA